MAEETVSRHLPPLWCLVVVGWGGLPPARIWHSGALWPGKYKWIDRVIIVPKTLKTPSFWKDFRLNSYLFYLQRAERRAVLHRLFYGFEAQKHQMLTFVLLGMFKTLVQQPTMCPDYLEMTHNNKVKWSAHNRCQSWLTHNIGRRDRRNNTITGMFYTSDNIMQPFTRSHSNS